MINTSFFRIAIVLALNLIAFQTATAQSKKRILFIGNSYVASNNLPAMLANIALSTGDTIIYDSNTPGGYTFQGHSNNTTSLSKIQQSNWDYVVLQEQSQLPSFPLNQVEYQVFPFATKLDSIIHAWNPCAKTMFYMTWGRKNGDSQNCAFQQEICTYEGMDNLLRERYMMMAEQNDAMVSPVGAVWRYIRANHPEIELYVADESHPSVAGTYAAACAFYTSVLRKDPTLITATSGLSQDIASKIKTAAKLVVLDSLSTWKINAYDPTADFEFASLDNTVTFDNQSTNADSYIWNFGDGGTSTNMNPTHVYQSVGTYTVQLTAIKCNETTTTTQTITIASLNVLDNNPLSSIHVFPNPTTESLVIDGAFTRAELRDGSGRIVLTEVNNNTMDCTNLAAGTYHLIIQHEGFSYTKKIVKY